MSNHEQSEEQIRRNLEALELSKQKRYEQREMDVPRVGKAIGAFFEFSTICVVAATASMFAIYKWVNKVPREFNTPGINQAITAKPAKAPLQDNVAAKKDIADLRHQEDAKTEVYAMKDGKIQIPITRAMEIVAAKGLAEPVPTAPGMPAADGAAPAGTPTQPSTPTNP